MMFSEINWSDPGITDRFSLKGAPFTRTYEYYYNAYNTALRVIFEKGLKKHYDFNNKSRGILYLLRHSLELCLKLNLEREGRAIPSVHDFQDLVAAFPAGAIPAAIIDILNRLNHDSNGSAYRYLTPSGEKKRYFGFKDTLELAPILQTYNSALGTADFVVGEICRPFDYSSSSKSWDLTFHPGITSSLGGIKAEYDLTIGYLVEAIIMEEVSIGEIWLPLLFLVRHGLELALKSNVSEVQEFSKIIKQKNYQSEHSLARLYGVYRDYLQKLKVDELGDDIKIQYQGYLSEYDKLNGILHVLDVNSRYFRYPVRKDGSEHPSPLKPQDIDVAEIIRLKEFTNPFIVFTNVVLAEIGVLE